MSGGYAELLMYVAPAQVREATDKTRELHHAYALIREYRGFR